MREVTREPAVSRVAGTALNGGAEADPLLNFARLTAAGAILPRGWTDFAEHTSEGLGYAIVPEDDVFSENGDTPADAAGFGLGPTGRRGLHRDLKGDARSAEDADLDGFGRFLRQAAQVALLTHEQEIELAQEVERGDPAAVNRLIVANIRLVVSLAGPLARVTRLPLEDLVQEGTFGLRRAAEKFDWRRGNKFGTYATWWILQAMRHFVASQKHTLHIPSHIHERLGQLRQTIRRLSRELRRNPTEQEIADAMHLPPQKVGALLLLAQDTVPLDVPLGDPEDPRPREETIQDNTTPSPEEELIWKERRAELDEALSRVLTPRERTVLCRLFGYPAGTPLKPREVADQFGITTTMVKKIQCTALEKLRDRAALMMLRDFQETRATISR